ncbi:hypothetical protein [Spiroplasma ixodetis]|uniref:hypothetical protein n=1 Tax=Spiroplasma ixodetis TaxID=2141 RepID=UPI002578BACB|nr:hypothetical protein [Spiroplasma ixodetis]WJG70700.1 hypothetical protein SIXOD_v1c19150 [Spiroplasma ixodetis Y32]
MSAILNFNSVVFSPLIQMPYDSTQWLPFALSDIPLIDKLLNALTLGIWSSWVITQNFQQYKKMLYFNGFMSAFFTSNLENIIGNGGLIPLNAFTNDNDFAIGKLLGANVSTTAMTMKLSDRVSVYPWDPTTGQKLTTKEQISTVDLSQKKNNKVYILAEDTEFLDIASPFTNEDTETQWNPTSNGVIDGSNYAYIIDTIVIQSLHQGEERHTFYSDNPFTYQGDYNEISVAQFRYNNMGYLTGNAFNWTTLYKLNHDEYEESEETIFSYPAKILPPSPQNIAKQIVIIPKNPSIETTLQNWNILMHNNQEIYKDDTNWINNNVPLIKPLEININFKDYLDPTLLIKSFNDLKRYYKSVDVYLHYEYATEEWPKIIYDDIITTENFIPNKSQTLFKSYNLSELFYYTKENKMKVFEDFKIEYYQVSSRINQYVGVSKIGLIPTNINNLYEISKNGLYSQVNYSYDKNINMNSENSTYLGFYDLSDKEFKWKIELFPIINQIQGADFQIQPEGFTWVEKNRLVKKYKLSISKIVFNSR